MNSHFGNYLHVLGGRSIKEHSKKTKSSRSSVIGVVGTYLLHSQILWLLFIKGDLLFETFAFAAFHRLSLLASYHPKNVPCKKEQGKVTDSRG